MDVPASLKQKGKVTTWGGLANSMENKLDDMICQMQETGPVLIEFVKMYGLCTPNHPLNMFASELVHGEEEDDDFEGEAAT